MRRGPRGGRGRPAREREGDGGRRHGHRRRPRGEGPALIADYSLRRLRNGLAKVAAGLTPFGESVWPGVRNDLFVAHESLYLFFAALCGGRRVLDAGCGTGYGAAILAKAGAASVLAVDVDRRSVRYARRRFPHPSVSYEVRDCETLALAPGSLDLVVSSNMLEHLERPAAFLEAIAGALVPGGRAVLAVPPITFAEALAEHHAIHYHRSNLSVDEWLALFRESGWSVEVLAHRYPPDPWRPDFSSHAPSVLSAEEFVVVPASRDTLYADPPITAVFSLTRAAA